MRQLRLLSIDDADLAIDTLGLVDRRSTDGKIAGPKEGKVGPRLSLVGRMIAILVTQKIDGILPKSDLGDQAVIGYWNSGECRCPMT